MFDLYFLKYNFYFKSLISVLRALVNIVRNIEKSWSTRKKMGSLENEKYSVSVVWATFPNGKAKKVILSKFQNGKSLGIGCHAYH